MSDLERELAEWQAAVGRYEDLLKAARGQVHRLTNALRKVESDIYDGPIRELVRQWVDEARRTNARWQEWMHEPDGANVHLLIDTTESGGWELITSEDSTAETHAWVIDVGFSLEHGVRLLGESYDDHCGPPEVRLPKEHLLSFMRWVDPHVRDAIVRETVQRWSHWIWHREVNAGEPPFRGIPRDPEVLAFLKRHTEDEVRSLEECIATTFGIAGFRFYLPEGGS